MRFGLNIATCAPDGRGRYIISVSGKLFIHESEDYREELIHYAATGEFFEVFLSYEGNKLLLPTTKLNGEYVNKLSSVRWEQHIDYDGSLTYQFGELIHPFQRTSGFMAKHYMPYGIVIIEGK